MQSIITYTPGQTRHLGKKTALEIMGKSPGKKAVLLCLEGELGGGKTTFVQGFASGMGIKEKILSPTFVIARRFPIKKNKHFGNFFHLDCYRIKKGKEIADLGFKEIIDNPHNIVAVEWPDRIKKMLPRKRMVIKFIFLDRNKRKIQITKKGGK